MFREMRRFKQQVTTEECKKVLKEEKRAAFSVIGDDGYPYTIPINFYYDKEDNNIYFHGAKEGHKVDAMNRCDKVCLTVWNQGFRKDGHWEWNPTTDEIEKEMERSAARAQLFAIKIEHMTGKLVNEK